MLWVNALLAIIGLGVLVWGADLLVRGAAQLAALIGVPALFVGLTVVAFGTSLPELAIALRAAAGGQDALTVGNVLGSNIANILLILGLGALLAPMVIAPSLLRREVPLMIVISAALWAVSHDLAITPSDGVVLLLLAGLWLLQSGLAALDENRELRVATQQPLFRGRVVVLNSALTVGGLALVVVGAQLLTDNAVVLARAFGVGELFIGLTIVAIGTSLPEIATTVLAALRGERELAVGNVVGSNIINIGVVLGLTALVTPGGVSVPSAALNFDLPVVMVSAVACLPIFLTGELIGRPQGALFFGFYLAYLGYLIIDALNAPFRDQYLAALLYFVLPLTAVTLAAVVWRLRRGRRAVVN
jgi:cation:H+ antiporter